VRLNFLFAVWPYIAASLLAVGISVRYLLERRNMDAVSAEMSEAWAFIGGARWLRASVLLLFLAHLAGLLFPRELLLWNGNPVRLYMLEGLAFAIGVVALSSGAGLLWRHLGHSHRSAIIELSDTVFLSLFFVGIISGLLAAALYRWGSSWGAITLSPYVASLVRGNPAAGFAVQMPFLVRLHVFSSFAMLAVFPLTRVASFVVFALHRSFGFIGRPISAGARTGEAWLRKHNPAPWLWPEED
jgi:nitrate reductase gamma subunit